jgi:hypothetical protein
MKKYFKGDIIITDPCYIIKNYNPEWSFCEYGDKMEVLGINTYLTSATLYGDWSCTTYKKENSEVLGHFCADAGLVSVFLLEEVLKYNPFFNYHITKPHTTTLIKDFDGEVEICIMSPTMFKGDEVKIFEDDELEDDDNFVSVIGTGNINFITRQTGL